MVDGTVISVWALCEKNFNHPEITLPLETLIDSGQSHSKVGPVNRRALELIGGHFVMDLMTIFHSDTLGTLVAKLEFCHTPDAFVRFPPSL